MAFFDIPADDELSPQARQLLDAYRRLSGNEHYSPSLKVMAHLPNLIEARVKANELLNYPSGYSRYAVNLAWMLVAHAKRCRVCFAGSRRHLDKLGFDEETLDGICANPDTLPLNERDRLLVHYIFKIATGPADLQPKDFRDMEAHGFSKNEILEMIAIAAYMNFQMVFTMSLFPAMYEEE
jgi:uncharacterized peroxidase-related enzyme